MGAARGKYPVQGGSDRVSRIAGISRYLTQES